MKFKTALSLIQHDIGILLNTYYNTVFQHIKKPRPREDKRIVYSQIAAVDGIHTGLVC